jgi:hypothetical protein
MFDSFKKHRRGKNYSVTTKTSFGCTADETTSASEIEEDFILI